MKATLALSLAALLLAAAGCGKHSAPTSSPPPAPPPEAPGSSLFPAPQPIADARPDIREKRTFQVPSRLVVGRMVDRITVAVDKNSLEAVQIEAGQKMAFGFKARVFVTVGGQRNPMTTYVGGTPDFGPVSFTRQLGGFPEEGQSYDVEVEIELFETDIPVQHMWSPEAGKYRQLWSRTLKGKSPSTSAPPPKP